jgi:hypothetical protein
MALRRSYNQTNEAQKLPAKIKLFSIPFDKELKLPGPGAFAMSERMVFLA